LVTHTLSGLRWSLLTQVVLLIFALSCGRARQPVLPSASATAVSGIPVPAPVRPSSEPGPSETPVAITTEQPISGLRGEPSGTRAPRATRTPAPPRAQAPPRVQSAPSGALVGLPPRATAPVDVVPGARAVSVSTNAPVLGIAPLGRSCPPAAPIKGSKAHVYHTPASRTYETVQPVACFSSPAEAAQAGYRASGQ
jgi:hypothetical protein